MNTSTNGLPFMQSDVYRVTRELVVRVGALKIADRELRDQASRAAASVLLQLSEGLPLESQAARRKYFNEAKGSVCEVAAAIDVAAALGVARSEEVAQLLLLAGRVKKMLWRLSQSLRASGGHRATGGHRHPSMTIGGFEVGGRQVPRRQVAHAQPAAKRYEVRIACK